MINRNKALEIKETLKINLQNLIDLGNEIKQLSKEQQVTQGWWKKRGIKSSIDSKMNKLEKMFVKTKNHYKIFKD